MRALLIIDMQNDFMPKGPLGIKNADKIIPIINKLIDVFDFVLATKDFHPRSHVSFASSFNKKIGEQVLVNNHLQQLWPDHCIQNTKGADFVDSLRVEKINKIFEKGTDRKVDSYSAFFDNDHKRSTELESFLKNNQIKKLYLSGVATDYCVKFSAIDALGLGFEVFLIKDACMPVNKNNEPKVLSYLKKKGAHIISSSEIFSY